MATIQRSDSSRFWQGGGAAGLSFTAGGNADGAATSEDKLTVSMKLKLNHMILLYDPEITLLGIYLLI